jgi:LemA protein
MNLFGVLGTFAVIAFIASILLIIFLFSIYNRIIVLENRFKNAWSQIDVQLKRRNDLIPNLLETVKGYAKHEREVFEQVAKSRERMMQAGSIDERAEAANMMTAALRSVFAIAESYPELKANQNFMMLQEELSSVENKIAYARQFYNDAVLQYNNAVETVPGVFIAGPMGKQKHVYLEIPETEKAVPRVSFS